MRQRYVLALVVFAFLGSLLCASTAFAKEMVVFSQINLGLLNVESGNIVQLAQLTRLPSGATPGGFDLSPDGKEIAFWDADGLNILDVQSRTTRNLVPSPRGGISPRWLPDGNMIAFATAPPADNWQDAHWSIYLVSPQGGAPREVLDLIGDADLADLGTMVWSADSQELWFSAVPNATWDRRSIYALNVNTKALRPVLAGEKLVYSISDSTTDGRVLFFLTHLDPVPDGTPKSSFATCDQQGEGVLPILTWINQPNTAGPRLSPDGRRVVFGGNGEVLMVADTRDGANLRQFPLTPGDYDLYEDPNLDVSPANQLTTTWGAVKADKMR